MIDCADGLLKSTARISNRLSILGNCPPYNEKGGILFVVDNITISSGCSSTPLGALSLFFMVP